MPLPQRAIATLAVLCGVAMVLVSNSVISIALPTIARNLHLTGAGGTLLISAYQFALLTTILPVTAIGQIYGTDRLFATALIIFCLGCIGCFISRSLPLLLAFRCVSGIAGGTILSVSMYLLERIFPSRLLGRALSLNTATISLSVILAPALTSIMLSTLDWPWLFAAGVPFGGVGLVLSRHLLRPRSNRRASSGHRSLSLCSLSLNVLSFSSFFAFTASLAWDSSLWSISLAACLVFGWLYLRDQQGRQTPDLPLDLLRRPAFRLSALSTVLCFTAQNATILLLPFHLESLGFPAVRIGLLLMAWPCCHIPASLASGFITEHSNPSLVCIAGLSLCTLGIFSLVTLPSSADSLAVAWRLGVCGLG